LPHPIAASTAPTSILTASPLQSSPRAVPASEKPLHACRPSRPSMC
jgi:hypothetical protein